MKRFSPSEIGMLTVLLSLIAKFTLQSPIQSSFSIFGWMAFGGWIVWILYAFQHDKDIPGVGPFSYQNGENQLARIFFTIAMVGMFFVAIVFSSFSGNMEVVHSR